LIPAAASQKLAPSGWTNSATGDSVAFPMAGQDGSWEQSGMLGSAATPAVSNNSFLGRDGDACKEEKKKKFHEPGWPKCRWQ